MILWLTRRDSRVFLEGLPVCQKYRSASGWRCVGNGPDRRPPHSLCYRDCATEPTLDFWKPLDPHLREGDKLGRWPIQEKKECRFHGKAPSLYHLPREWRSL